MMRVRFKTRPQRNKKNSRKVLTNTTKYVIINTERKKEVIKNEILYKRMA